MIEDQTDIFASSEGNAYFARNRDDLSRPERPDLIGDVLGQLANPDWESVCEIGCADGWRLDRLRKRFSGLKRLCGFDASTDAIEAGRRRSPELELSVGLVDAPPVAGPFDLVIISFVLHWIARERLARSIDAIDSLVAEEGTFVLVDFFPDAPTKTKYHHLPKRDVFTFKQDYRTAFAGLNLYREIYHKTFDHSDLAGVAKLVNGADRSMISVFRKSGGGFYE